ncbi:MAG: alkaline phosphatase family protein [Actinomycetota bacterium]
MRRGGGPALALALAVLAGACDQTSPSPNVPSARQGEAVLSDLALAACAMPHEQLVRIWRGVHPTRSGDIIVVPEEPNFLGSSFPHSGPWDYLQRVPMLWYGPGFIRPVGRVDRPVTMADVAPTQAALLGFDFTAPDGAPLSEALAPSVGRGELPRLIVTVVWDAGGRDVIDEWSEATPALAALIEKGAWYENATVGSSPSITPAVHATLGTGAFPMRTGQVDSELRIGPDLVRSGELGPGLLMEPTLADLYDRAMENEPLVGLVATVTWHLNMMGHGSMWGGGDRDVAVLRTTSDDEGAEGTEWNLQDRNALFFTLPSYVNDLPPLSSYAGVADLADGTPDGKWRGHEFAELRGGFDTPARLPYQSRLIEEIIGREDFGDDDVPDLFFTNYKLIDEVGHHFSLNSVEMRDAVKAQDEELARLVEFLNREVGRRRWVLLVTADHGHQFDPAVSGAFQVTPRELSDDLTARFDDADGVPVVTLVRTSQIFLNEAELQGNGYTLDDVARFVLDYTKGQAAEVPKAERDDTVFSAAFPTSILEGLECLPEARA